MSTFCIISKLAMFLLNSEISIQIAIFIFERNDENLLITSRTDVISLPIFSN